MKRSLIDVPASFLLTFLCSTVTPLSRGSTDCATTRLIKTWVINGRESANSNEAENCAFLHDVVIGLRSFLDRCMYDELAKGDKGLFRIMSFASLEETEDNEAFHQASVMSHGRFKSVEGSLESDGSSGNASVGDGVESWSTGLAGIDL